jgi:hypothetical protein
LRQSLFLNWVKSVGAKSDEAGTPLLSLSPTMLKVHHWMVKAAAQKAFSALPGGKWCNRFCQRYFTRSLDLDENHFETALGHCRKHLESYFATAGDARSGFSVFELGTGWYPILPIGLYLCGASRIWTMDIDPLLTVEATHKALQFYSRYAEQDRLAGWLPWIQAARLRAVIGLAQAGPRASASEMLRPLKIYPMVGDARRVKLASGSVDFFLSNGVLQHIPEEVLTGIFTEFRRLAAARAFMSHQVYFGDPFVGFDPAVNVFNLLRFSGPMWKLIDNSLKPHSRLRLNDYRRIHRTSGWPILTEDSVYGCIEDLRKIPLAEEFREYSEQDLLAVRSWLLSHCLSAARSNETTHASN